ncbi:MAG: hypothetical protein ACKOTB_01990, partial [Planctomycetia bacterium]
VVRRGERRRPRQVLGKEVELRQLADSSLVAVMGRMAAYSGQKVTSKFAPEESQIDLLPKDLTWPAALPAPHHDVTGETKLV